MRRILLGIGAMMIALLMSLWLIGRMQTAKAKEFCERLADKIEKSKVSSGKYPPYLNPEWMRGYDLPKLIDTNAFYYSDGDVYSLRFRNPYSIIDPYYEYSGALKRWFVFD